MADYIETPEPIMSCFDSLYVQANKIVLYQEFNSSKLVTSEEQKDFLSKTIVSISIINGQGLQDESKLIGIPPNGTGFIFDFDKINSRYLCFTAAHVFGNPSSDVLERNFYVKNDKQAVIAKGRLIGHPWLSLEKKDAFNDGTYGIDPITGFQFIMPNDVAIFEFKSDKKLECLNLSLVPQNSEERKFFILGYPSKFSKISIHTPHYQEVTKPPDPSEIPYNCLVIAKAVVGTSNKKKIAFKASTGPGMSGGPLVYYDKGWHVCGTYNGPAAVPWHRLLGLHFTAEGIDQPEYYEQIKIVALFMKKFAVGSKFERSVLKAEEANLYQAVQYLLNRKARKLVQNFDPEKNNHNLATPLQGPFFDKLIKATINSEEEKKLFKTDETIKILNIDDTLNKQMEFQQIWKDDIQTVLINLSQWYNPTQKNLTKERIKKICNTLFNQNFQQNFTPELFEFYKNKYLLPKTEEVKKEQNKKGVDFAKLLNQVQSELKIQVNENFAQNIPNLSKPKGNEEEEKFQKEKKQGKIELTLEIMSQQQDIKLEANKDSTDNENLEKKESMNEEDSIEMHTQASVSEMKGSQALD